MAKPTDIKNLSSLLPELLDGWENLFTAARELRAVLSLNGLMGKLTLVDTDGLQVTINPDTGKITVGNATALRNILLASNVGTPNDNDILRYDAATGKWQAEALP